MADKIARKVKFLIDTDKSEYPVCAHPGLQAVACLPKRGRLFERASEKHKVTPEGLRDEALSEPESTGKLLVEMRFAKKAE